MGLMFNPDHERSYPDKNSACDGPCKLEWDTNTHTRRCRRCGFPSQELVDGEERHPIEGDYRVVCTGPVHRETGRCPIGPSEATPLITTAKERLQAHQHEASRILSYCPKCEIVTYEGIHNAKIVQL